MSEKQHDWDIDWFVIEQEYITAQKKISMRKLAIKHFPGDPTKPDESGRLKAFTSALERQAAHGPRGKWTDQRKQYWKQISQEVLGEKTEDEVTRIKKMQEQERAELEKSLKVTESMIARLLSELEKGETEGSFLFPSMNREELLQGLNTWSQVRERIQKMLYKSYDIAERQDIKQTNVDVSSETAEAAVFEKMFGGSPFDPAAEKNLQQTQAVPA